MSRQRADLALVSRGFFASRAKAQEAIAMGLVRVDGRSARESLDADRRTTPIEAAAAYPWVSRGGVKLDAALDAFGFDPKDLPLPRRRRFDRRLQRRSLSRGAAQIYAVDVGHGQLAEDCAHDPRVIVLEATDARL